MEILQIVGIGIVSTILAVVVRRSIGSEFAIFISLATGILIFFMIMDKLAYVVDTLNQLIKSTNIQITYFSVILKIIGIAYIVEFGAQISRDAGEDAIASKIEMAGKMLIMVLAIPIMLALLELIIKMLP
ncbi:stage III sporulation protein AD [Tepidimicrobium xylanilyticum]|uniref:Stage III sporulation protein AD n=1 Tax=Tepidimicrobium xylanilyticum TaxID=1123352 RepID=A0A1H3CQ99_9FIRM|nr:stage III sporulation protein AD [Tepidimicrobium xylanilyticum]GMG97711.1 stage III sporulation protein AD [Tepidimicrobium xylanilyticum]SDX56422.1 stage III sporulation protein AD [Tepidimicrobium xylanilyticum]